MKPRLAASLVVLMTAATACTSWRPWTPEPEATLAPAIDAAKVNRFADATLGEPDLSRPAYSDPALDALRSAKLARFNSEAEFHSWLKLVRDASQARGGYWWRGKMAYETAMPAP
ncbi:MAG TPA: hypothetical protein PKV67_05580, partial [Hyphomonas sp.]|nr:hypothetical protein [Hyphomonas sp.]